MQEIPAKPDEPRVHMRAFGGYDHNAALSGEAVEKDVPLCRVSAGDPRLTSDEHRVTCKRCLEFLEPKP